jgi:uncharacterized SAM-binding protein YcdF (DUF218 family)
VAGVLGLVLISWPPADWLFGRPLEARYPVRPFVAPSGLEAIVVLGSAVEPVQFERPYPLPDRDTFSRCEHAAWIYKRWGPIPVLACEGRQQPTALGNMRTLLQRAGVSEKMIWMEEESRTTHENAVYGARILRSHGVKHIALVVEGQSMPRAAACFRKEGIDVIPAPSELRTWGPLSEELLPNWRAIRRNEITLHEIVGLGWYKLRGWI